MLWRININELEREEWGNREDWGIFVFDDKFVFETKWKLWLERKLDSYMEDEDDEEIYKEVNLKGWTYKRKFTV